MKTLCVAVVLLSLTSVCQPASLACEKLLKPVDNAPDLSGRWYIVAGSSENCVIPLVNALLWPSLKVDITSKDTPNVYNANTTVKIFGYCESDAEDFYYQNKSMYDVDSNNAPTGKPAVIMHTDCQDCIVVKEEEDELLNTVMLFSRRQSVTDAELQEFESQVKCMGWSKMQVFNTEHDYQTCKSIEDDETDSSKIASFIIERMKKSYREIIRCLMENIFASPTSAVEWIRELIS